MGLIKTRPNLSLFAPREIVTGRSFKLTAVLDCVEPVPVDNIQLELIGTGVWYSSTQYGQHRHTAPFFRAVAKPQPVGGELSEGRHEVPVIFNLPVDLPGSYAGRLLRVEWSARITVDIPWWPDARASFSLHVRSAREPEAGQQMVFVSDSGGPRARKPYAEVSLGTTEIVPGGELRGRVALSNTDANDYRGVQLALIGVESIGSLLGAQTQNNRIARWQIPVDAPKEDEPIEFKLRLPRSITGAFETRRFSLKWYLEVRPEVAWSIDRKLWIPLTVRSDVGPDQGEVQAPLAVGSDRLALIWEDVGRRTGFNYADSELTRDVGHCHITIRREHRGRRGHCVVGEARLPEVNLGLRCHKGRLRCRDTGQSDILAERTDDLAAKCNLAEADDAAITSELDNAGTGREPLEAFARSLEALVRAYDHARAELPPPAAMADLLPAFREGARRLGAELDPATMCIAGTYDELEFALRTEWEDSGDPDRTAIEVEPLVPVDSRYRQTWDGDSELGPLPDGFEPLLEGAKGLEIGDSLIRIVFGPKPDVFDLVSRLQSLIAIALKLSGRVGAYR